MRFLCSWDSLGKNPGAGSHSRLFVFTMSVFNTPFHSSFFSYPYPPSGAKIQRTDPKVAQTPIPLCSKKTKTLVPPHPGPLFPTPWLMIKPLPCWVISLQPNNSNFFKKSTPLTVGSLQMQEQSSLTGLRAARLPPSLPSPLLFLLGSRPPKSSLHPSQSPLPPHPLSPPLSASSSLICPLQLTMRASGGLPGPWPAPERGDMKAVTGPAHTER